MGTLFPLSYGRPPLQETQARQSKSLLERHI